MNLRKISSLSLVLFLFVGCASVEKGNDELLVRAEQTRAAALETFDTFVKYEYNNRAALWRVSREIKHTADVVRTIGKAGLKELDGAIDDYKGLRNVENGDKLNTTITFVATLSSRAFNALAQGKAALEASNKK